MKPLTISSKFEELSSFIKKPFQQIELFQALDPLNPDRSHLHRLLLKCIIHMQARHFKLILCLHRQQRPSASC